MASITDQTRWRRILNHVAADLLATVTLAGLRGIIPNPITATRLYEAGAQVGEGSAEVYSVLANTKLFIHTASANASESADASDYALLGVRDAGDDWVYTIIHFLFEKAGQMIDSKTFYPAIEVPALSEVYVISGNANIEIAGQIFGWLEDV